jgi:hypothetical protein
LRSTSSANASHVEASSGRVVNRIVITGLLHLRRAPNVVVGR